MFEQSGISWSLAVAIPLGRSCVAALYHQSYRYCWWSCQILLPTLSSLLVVGMVNVWQQYNTLSVWVMVLTFNCCGSSVYILVCILYSINDVSSWFHEFRLRSSFSCLLVVPSFQVTKGFYICVYINVYLSCWFSRILVQELTQLFAGGTGAFDQTPNFNFLELYIMCYV